MPNRRRRRLSTAMSTVAALAVASPVAVIAVSDLSAPERTPQHREFVQAAMVTDLPGELISAPSPRACPSSASTCRRCPTGLLTGSDRRRPSLPHRPDPPGLAAPGLTDAGADRTPA